MAPRERKNRPPIGQFAPAERFSMPSDSAKCPSRAAVDTLRGRFWRKRAAKIGVRGHLGELRVAEDDLRGRFPEERKVADGLRCRIWEGRASKTDLRCRISRRRASKVDLQGRLEAHRPLPKRQRSPFFARRPSPKRPSISNFVRRPFRNRPRRPVSEDRASISRPPRFGIRRGGSSPCLRRSRCPQWGASFRSLGSRAARPRCRARPAKPVRRRRAGARGSC